MTAAQKVALDKGRKKRHEETKARKTARKKEPKATKSRHQMLVDGELTVDELDDEELQRFRGRDINGEFVGRTKPLSPKLQAEIRQKLLSAMQTNIEGFLPRATALLARIAEDSDSDAARVKAIDLMLQRGAGKVPDVVRVGVEDPWDAVLADFLKAGTSDDPELAKARERLERMTQGLSDEEDL